MKVIVAHPAQQHSFRLALALKKSGFLFKYATTVFLKKGTLTSLVIPILPKKFKKRAQGRKCESLNDDVILFCQNEGLIRLLSQNVRFLKKYHNTVRFHLADRFAKKVAKYAIKNKVDVVVTYDDCSPLLFEMLKEIAPNIIRVLDTSAANRLYMRYVYEKDVLLAPKFAAMLHRECPQVWSKKILSRVTREIESSDFFLVPSEFVSKSLNYSGIKNEQIIKCPYGVDLNLFTPKNDKPNYPSKPVRFIYVGGVKELKGISYLLEAFSRVPKEKARLTVVGDNAFNSNVVLNLASVEFTGRVMHSEIPKLLQNSDVFIFPSLGDSFSLSALEAAACGLPLVLSENTGVADYIHDGVEGFIVPIQSVDVLTDRINWFTSNPSKITEMGSEARKMAEKLTWANYDKRICEEFNRLNVVVNHDNMDSFLPWRTV